MMKAFIRVDASLDIGTGHVMRCLTLAGYLSKQGHTVHFICRELTGHLCDFIEENGFEVLRLPSCGVLNENNWNLSPYLKLLGVSLRVDAKQTMEILKQEIVDVLVIDHYAIDESWERNFRDVSKKIMVIDDLANRKHDCDLLLDQNFYENYPSRYHSLVPKQCKCYLGPRYVLLRQEFHEQWKKQSIRNGPVKRILIFFGGIDRTNETRRAIDSFLRLERGDIQVDVVVGRENPHIKELKRIYQRYDNLHFYCQVSNIAELMGQADLAIGAGGSTTWERCYLGLPSIVWSIAENQEEICKGLGRKKIIKYLGNKEMVEESSIEKQLIDMINNEVARHEMSCLSYHFMKNLHVSHQTMIEEIVRVDE